jgi:hypothetical protein
MEAACYGVSEARGVVLRILPGEKNEAIRHIKIAICHGHGTRQEYDNCEEC